VRLHWLLPSFLGFFLLSSPAEAARLLTWRFDADQNQLSFTTDEGVQPKAQLIVNPTRLVIDLPGISLGRPKIEQPVGIDGLEEKDVILPSAQRVAALLEQQGIDPD